MKTLTLKRWLTIIVGLALLLAVAIIAGILWGSQTLSWGEVFSATLTVDQEIFFLSRLPHVLLAAVVGMALGAAGASFQGLLRNPLADPFILGVSSGAALGSVIALACGVVFPWISLIAFLSALAAMGLVYSLAAYRKRLSSETLLLTGVVFNAFAFAFILIINTLVSVEQAHKILFMLIGSLEITRYTDLWVVTGLVLLGMILLTREGRPLNLLSEGAQSAAVMGIDPAVHQRRIFIGASMMVGAVVSLSGLIGFVGLFVPHIVRRLWGPDHRLLVPASGLMGAVLLIICDMIARTVGVRSGFVGHLPVGAITALFGAPFFLILLRRMK